MTADFVVSRRRCRLHACPNPEVLLVEPVDEQDLAFLDREMDHLLAHAPRSFALATFLIADWNHELTPWKADAVFGKEPFGDGAGDTLAFVTGALLPDLEAKVPALKGVPVILGGYSLAAFFALWASYACTRFAAVAAASPSVWYPGWMEYARAHVPHTGRVCLSLGDTEEKTRNRVMSRVGDCIREQAEILSRQGIPCTLTWNPGNHFKDADLRTAKAFLDAMR